MARTWSMELGRAGITVNAIVPVAATAMTETIPVFAPYVEAMRNGEPLPDFLRKGEGFGTPEDCAALVPFLASDAARGVTGQAIGIGGDKVALSVAPAGGQDGVRGRRLDPQGSPWPTPGPRRSAPSRRPSGCPRRSFRRRDGPERTRRDRRPHPRGGVLEGPLLARRSARSLQRLLQGRGQAEAHPGGDGRLLPQAGGWPP